MSSDSSSTPLLLASEPYCGLQSHCYPRLFLDIYYEFGGQRKNDWYITARGNHGPEIPCSPALVLARKLARGEVSGRGAVASLGLVDLSDFEAELQDLEVSWEVVEYEESRNEHLSIDQSGSHRQCNSPFRNRDRHNLFHAEDIDEVQPTFDATPADLPTGGGRRTNEIRGLLP